VTHRLDLEIGTEGVARLCTHLLCLVASFYSFLLMPDHEPAWNSLVSGKRHVHVAYKEATCYIAAVAAIPFACSFVSLYLGGSKIGHKSIADSRANREPTGIRVKPCLHKA
jgi:hypothetical protein